MASPRTIKKLYDQYSAAQNFEKRSELETELISNIRNYIKGWQPNILLDYKEKAKELKIPVRFFFKAIHSSDEPETLVTTIKSMYPEIRVSPSKLRTFMEVDSPRTAIKKLYDQYSVIKSPKKRSKLETEIISNIQDYIKGWQPSTLRDYKKKAKELKIPVRFFFMTIHNSSEPETLATTIETMYPGIIKVSPSKIRTLMEKSPPKTADQIAEEKERELDLEKLKNALEKLEESLKNLTTIEITGDYLESEVSSGLFFDILNKGFGSKAELSASIRIVKQAIEKDEIGVKRTQQQQIDILKAYVNHHDTSNVFRSNINSINELNTAVTSALVTHWIKNRGPIDKYILSSNDPNYRTKVMKKIKQILKQEFEGDIKNIINIIQRAQNKIIEPANDIQERTDILKESRLIIDELIAEFGNFMNKIVPRLNEEKRKAGIEKNSA